LKLLKIRKKVTCYSLKRNGVTFRRLRGDSDATIQHTARWTSTKQLKTYDMSEQEETFKIELVKRGLIKADEQHKKYETTFKRCMFCDFRNGIADDICNNCKRPLDRKKILDEQKNREDQIKNMQKEMEDYKKEMMSYLMAEAKKQISKEIEAKINS